MNKHKTSKLFALCSGVWLLFTASFLSAAQFGLFYYEMNGTTVTITGYASGQTG